MQIGHRNGIKETFLLRNKKQNFEAKMIVYEINCYPKYEEEKANWRKRKDV